MSCKKCGDADEQNAEHVLVKESGLYAVLCPNCWDRYSRWEFTDPIMVAIRNCVQQIRLHAARRWLSEKESADA